MFAQLQKGTLKINWRLLRPFLLNGTEMPKTLLETGQWTRDTFHLDSAGQNGLKTGKLEFSWEGWLNTLVFHLKEADNPSQWFMVLQRWAGSYGGKPWGRCFSEKTLAFSCYRTAVKCKEVQSSSLEGSNAFSTKAGVWFLVRFYRLTPWVGLRAAPSHWNVPHYIGSRCVVSRTWCHRVTKKSDVKEKWH